MLCIFSISEYDILPAISDCTSTGDHAWTLPERTSTTAKKMLKNINITNGLIFSQRVMLELTNRGFTREKAYTLVQKNAQNSLKKNITFYESLAKDSLINKLISNKDLKEMFDLYYHTKKINIIFKRVFK